MHSQLVPAAGTGPGEAKGDGTAEAETGEAKGDGAVEAGTGEAKRDGTAEAGTAATVAASASAGRELYGAVRKGGEEQGCEGQGCFMLRVPKRGACVCVDVCARVQVCVYAPVCAKRSHLLPRMLLDVRDR